MKRILVILFTVFCGATTWAQTGPLPQSEVKAVFLYNFTGFVDWPANALGDANAPLIIGILGDNPFGRYLEEAVQNERKEGHPIIIKYFNTIDEAKNNSHILFINRSTPEAAQALPMLKGKSILTVSDGTDFAKNGGMIRLYIENNKVKLQVNIEAVKEANLVISSKLLRLAEILNAKL